MPKSKNKRKNGKKPKNKKQQEIERQNKSKRDYANKIKFGVPLMLMNDKLNDL